MIVRDIMTTSVISASEQMPITQIAEIVTRQRIHAVPVVDASGKVVGIVTETDFFTKDPSGALYIPQLFDFIKSTSLSEGMDMNTAAADITAKDIMSEKCITVRPETTGEELVGIIRKSNYNSFPVVDENDKLIGIVTVYDMIKNIKLGQ